MSNTAMTKAVDGHWVSFSDAPQGGRKSRISSTQTFANVGFRLVRASEGRSSCAWCRDDKSRAGQGLQALPNDDFPGMVLCGNTYAEKKAAGAAIIETCKAQTSPESKEVGSYRGFTLLLSYDVFSKTFRLTLKNGLSHTVDLGADIHGNIQRIDNLLNGFPEKRDSCVLQLEEVQKQLKTAKAEADKPFLQEGELKEKSARLAELNTLLNLDKHENEIMDDAPEQEEEKTKRRSEPEYER